MMTNLILIGILIILLVCMAFWDLKDSVSTRIANAAVVILTILLTFQQVGPQAIVHFLLILTMFFVVVTILKAPVRKTAPYLVTFLVVTALSMLLGVSGSAKVFGSLSYFGLLLILLKGTLIDND